MLRSTLLRIFPPPRYLTLPALAFDISDRSIKYCSLERRRHRLGVRHWGMRELPTGAIVNGEIREAELVRAALAAIAKATGERFAMVALPEEPSYVVRLGLPVARRSELRQGVELQLEEHVPVPIPSLVFDYDIWREPVGSKGGYEVVVSAFPEPAAAAYLELFSNTGLRPLAFETEAQALARALASRSDTPILLIDFGRLHVGLVVAAKGLALRASTITEISGEALSRALQKGLGVDEAAAEELKRKHGLHEGEDNRLVFSLLPALSVLREEVVKFIGAWQVARVEGGSPRPPLGRVVLVGSEALLPGLVEYLAEGISLPVQIARVWQEILDEEVTIPPYPRAEALGFATALGLALRPYLRHE